MAGHGKEGLSRKQIKKLAGNIPDDEIRRSFENGTGDGFFVTEDGAFVACRTQDGGVMIEMNDDPVWDHARKEFLRRKNGGDGEVK